MGFLFLKINFYAILFIQTINRRKMMKKFFMLTLLLTAGTALAAPKSSHIELGSAWLPPTQQLKISLTQLVPSIAYDVTCTIYDQNSPQDKVILSTKTENICATSSTLGRYTLYNGEKEIRSWSILSSAQYQLPAATTKFIATLLYNPCGSLIFTNGDRNYPVFLNCSADANSNS
jgi:hypothetical protein